VKILGDHEDIEQALLVTDVVLQRSELVGIKVIGPRFEGMNHFSNGFREDKTHQPLQQSRSELEIDIEVDNAPVWRFFEYPFIFKILEGPVFIRNINRRYGSVERNPAGEPLCYSLESDHQIGDDKIVSALSYPRRLTPRQKIRIQFYLGDKIEHLIRAIR